ncbi:CBS domain-containing protein [Acidobacteriota bacterium]
MIIKEQESSLALQVDEDDSHLDHVLKQLISSHPPIGTVADKAGRVLGLISIEDVLEEILQTEIDDAD